MLHLLPIPVPWFIIGPLMGLVIAGMYALTNKHLGVSGAYVQFVDWARGRPTEVWRLWFLGGLVGGAALVAVLGESPQFGLGYGRLGEILPLGALDRRLHVGARSQRLLHPLARQHRGDHRLLRGGGGGDASPPRAHRGCAV